MKPKPLLTSKLDLFVSSTTLILPNVSLSLEVECISVIFFGRKRRNILEILREI